MKNPMEFPGVENDPQKKQLEEIVSFSKSNRISSEELFAAYQLAMGLSSEELGLKQAPHEEVFALAKMMDEHMKNGLAANRVAGLIDTKRTYESAVETYAAMVDVMQITEKEKEVLKSIVTQKRPGMIIVNDDKTGKGIAEITISKEVSGMEANDLAAVLIKYLKDHADKKISISFIAE